MEISTCVKYVGVNDHQVDLFEGQYKVIYKDSQHKIDSVRDRDGYTEVL